MGFNRAMERSLKRKTKDRKEFETPYVMDWKRAQQNAKLLEMRDEALRIGFQAGLNMVYDNAIKVKGISEARANEIVNNIKADFDAMARKLGQK